MLDPLSRRGVAEMGEGTDDLTTLPSSLSERRTSSSLEHRVDRRPSTMIELPPPAGRPSISLHLDHTDSTGSNNNSNDKNNRNDETGTTDVDSPTSPLSPTTMQYPHPPSNEAIEQIIANAMALAGSGPSSNSGSSSTPALPGQHAHPHPQPHQLIQHHVTQASAAGGPPAFPRSDGSFGSNNGAPGRPEGHGLSELGSRPGNGLRTGSDGYVGGTGTGYSGQLPPLGGTGASVGGGTGMGGRLGGTIGTFQGRSHTPIMFHPAAVGVDGRVNLFVGNLPYRVRWQDVKDLFRRAGTVLRADVALDPQSNRSRGHGSVLMGSQEDGIKAIEMFNGYAWQTRVLEVRPDRLPPEYEPHPYIPPSSYGNAMPGRGAGGAPPNMTGMGMGMGGMNSGVGVAGIGQGMGMNMNMGMGGPYSQGIVNWNNAQMNSPIRSAAQPRTAGSQLRHNGIVDQQVGGYMSESRLPISPPLADRRTPNPNQGGQISPFGGERERRTSFFNSGDDALKRTDSRATIGPSGLSPNVAQRMPVGAQTAHQGFQETRGIGPHGHLQQHEDDEQPSKGDFYEHRKSSTQASTIGESQYVFDSRRGSLVGIGHGLATRERGSEGSLFGNGSGSDPAQRPTYSRQDTVGGRLLYVANLPFNASWQELKDLFRTAGGNVVRADIALGPDGRSKGFGNVLFQNEEDAAVAVQAFDGFEFNGRAIKVRQDRNSTGPGISAQSASSGVQMAYGSAGPGIDGLPGHADRQPAQTLRQAIHLRQDRMLDNQLDPLSASSNGLGSSPKPVSQEDPKNQVTASIRRGQIGANVNANNGSSSGRFRNGSHPGRIIMPSFNGFGQPNPMSPVQPRGIPMTPSMPGYNFHAYPSTPPLHPVSFLSPGLGPFSPTLNSPTTFGFNPFHAAPGAPLMTPGVPHPMNNMGNVYGPPGAHNIAHTPGHGHFGQQNFPSTPGAPIGGRGPEPDYFPSIPSRTERRGSDQGFPLQTSFGALGMEDNSAGLGLAPISASDMQRLQNVTGSSPSGPSTGAIREQIESLVLSTDPVSSPNAGNLDAAIVDGPAGMIGATSRASFDFGLASRQALNAMLDRKGLGIEQNDREKERRASMDDGKRP